ncbi:MAG: DUF4097 family beta strand repeat protein [Clostridia bacterium]|nr:DUF4097 family beta strand repeat protein [Clostridia bacterium]
MKTGVKIWLITAAALTLIGGILFGGMMTLMSWDFTKLSTNQYETNEHRITEEFRSVLIRTDTADIKLVPSEDGTVSVVCHEQEKCRHEVKVADGTLVIERNDTRKWYEHIGINFGAPKITVSIPRGEYGTLSITSGTGDTEIPDAFRFESISIKESTGHVRNYASASGSITIKTSTGAIRVGSLHAGSLDLSVTTGDVTVSDVTCDGDLAIRVSTGKTYLENITCKNLISTGSTGRISLRNVIAAEKFSLERSTGDVIFDQSDAAEILVKTNTGDVIGTLLSEKVFITRSDTGHITVPHSITGGRCQITTDTGDITVSVLS